MRRYQRRTSIDRRVGRLVRHHRDVAALATEDADDPEPTAILGLLPMAFGFGEGVELRAVGAFVSNVNNEGPECLEDAKPGPEAIEPWAVSGDNGLTIMERAPFGVIAAITPGSHVVMVGAGFIAFTILNSILALDARLTVVEIAPHVLPRMIDAPGAALVESWLARHGVGGDALDEFRLDLRRDGPPVNEIGLRHEIPAPLRMAAARRFYSRT